MWIVTGNMYKGDYGSYVGLIGIFDDEAKANEAMEQSDATDKRIHEIELNKIYGGKPSEYICMHHWEPEIDLGGYAE